MKISLSNTESIPLSRKRLFAMLMANAGDGVNVRYLASMLASWYTEEGVLPACMGLTPESFTAMIERFFPAAVLPQAPARSDAWLSQMPEKPELEALFAENRPDDDISRQWIASILIAGCAGRRHLWEDLGLFSRLDLSAMLQDNFPALALKNEHDMKWKKFIYKQLCEREGIYACPAPTCAACADYALCFAPEDQPSS
ncbi:MAG: nitrogen fixation protein NifQ [Zetaproteobacteria bacterium CG12_big_fil_rev_8_21_14_0_65_54_13]|nr:MAG: nitrogen fixation protein NifQ [Zetaproteobacteria bacterium CG23_combo_of_CG06-09_8_20_14_all_54_7]PIW47291.1 MAG: nitrogen fixation protein NifQ [Zetaproteobacteria bacterium CG12_big_fil_rev_8_21_14_0_65_54_13]PIX54282.1 MAG: nitrogen fixation protein NifQ [Zetaproteobacteria bacterium CG_4_10_14_3_um_filter_54_28]PJA30427.1 MAG: nitrogen fixation protein NifQ [Zetaproteobacteria bacterium CG_4_9_14_3_um_filter_54_145]